MVNTTLVCQTVIRWLLRLFAATRPEPVEVEPGTVINIWSPSSGPTNENKKPALVFLHGFGFDGILTWALQIPAFAKHYSVYVPDLLFFGGSVTDRPERTPAFQAECVGKALRKLGVERCTVVGFSYGGAVGFELGGLFPGMVESLVLTGSVMEFTESIRRDGLGRIGYETWAEFMLPKTVEGVRSLLGNIIYDLPWLPNRLLKDALEVLFEHRKERAQLLDALFLGDNDVAKPASYCTQEINFIWGEEDRLIDIQEGYDRIKLLYGKATLKSIKKAGHLVQVERPYLYNRILKDLLLSLHQGG
ncbi:unnamed protein product [Linum tenue]|uniref:AB hydrolase-1 domain-containing protein n=1 Tax=Linum tenue TaxID=586396 RepID=A0AAV0GWS6_9ROSI|nr:unnamed protein product [Linum tenue]